MPAIVDTEGPGGHCQLEDAVGALVTGLGKLGVGTDAEYVEPDAERIGACVTIVTGGQEVTAKLEVVVDPTVGGQKSLRMTGRLEALQIKLRFTILGRAWTGAFVRHRRKPAPEL